jgi:hypothetical protein
MTLQSWITLALVALSVAYFFRGSFKSLVGGGCASGCGSCKSGGCPVNKLQAIQKELEAKPRKSQL